MNYKDCLLSDFVKKIMIENYLVCYEMLNLSLDLNLVALMDKKIDRNNESDLPPSFKP